MPIYDLARQSDAIVVATLKGATLQGGILKTQLQVSQIIKGELPSTTTFVDVVPSTSMAANPAVPAALVGRTGLWFLKRTNGGWRVLPRLTGEYASWDGYSLPLPDSSPISPSLLSPGVPDHGNSCDRFVLAAMLRWYTSLLHPERLDDGDVVDLAKWNRADALTFINALEASPKQNVQVLALAASIRLGADDALAALARKAVSFRGNPKFYEVTYALNNFYQPNGESSIAPLQALIGARLNVPGLDLAAGTALYRIRTKNVLPAMALLLDSPDPNAQLRAVSFFVLFTVFGQADGSMPQTGPVGPFWTSDAQAHQAGSNSRFKAPELVSFWKSWWAIHKAQLGFQ